jgi:hypothetical protein
MGPMVRAAVAAVLLALAPAASPAEAGAGAPPAADAARPGAADRLALHLRLVLEPSPAQGTVAAVADGGGSRAPTVCPPDWCQPRVDVPGLGGARPSPSRPELVAALLDAANLEPLADLAWLVVRTGVEVQWKPPRIGGGIGTGAGGYGDVLVWLKLRLDAWGRPTFPARTRGPSA